ncbi:MAG: hypothetical protein M1824_005687 [Vezdaea acicularis]|nr:MAG: hypothetical protein M1824_005687 [Vezdaea acicularis]
MSGPLVPIGTGQSPAFAQQGQVDWVSLSKSTFSVSFDVLNRLSRAGVEPLTFMSGSTVCSSFVLKPEAQKKVYDAVQKLKGFPSYGEVLWFGFGIKPILKDLANTESGLTCTALCAALTHTYGSFMAGQVLRELCQLNGADRSYMPSVPQFMRLADACAGALTSTKFPELVNGFARLIVPPSLRSGYVNPVPTTPEALATALVALARLSRQDSLSLTFTGGLDCAWILAIAEWLLLLTVELRDESELVLYRTRSLSQGMSVQVIVVCGTSQIQSLDSVMVSSRFICLPPGSPLITLDSVRGPNTPKTPGFATSSSWETIFQDTFGKSVDKLFRGKHQKTFGMLLHGVAYDPTSMCHGARTSLLGRMGLNWILCLYSGCGDGKGSNFLHFIVRKFPELRPCLEHIELDEPPGFTHMGFESCEKLLSQPCGMYPIHGFCNIVMVTTILAFLILMVSIRTRADQDILPTSRGLRLFYYSLKAIHAADRQEGSNLGPEDDPHMLLELNSKRFGSFEDHGPIESLLVIFTGRESTNQLEPSGSAARSSNGVCVYSPLLEDLNINPEQAHYLFVVPGRIQLEGEEYEVVKDVERGSASFSDATNAFSQPLLSYSLVAQVTQTRGVLKAEYRANAGLATDLSCGVNHLRNNLARAVYSSCMANSEHANVASQMVSLRSLNQSELEDSCVGKLKIPHLDHSEPQYQFLSPKKYTLLHRHDRYERFERCELLQIDHWRTYLGCGARGSCGHPFTLMRANDSPESIVHILGQNLNHKPGYYVKEDNLLRISITSPYAKRSPILLVFGDSTSDEVRQSDEENA